MTHQILYLNGPSSSVKSTLAKALQEALEEPFLHIGIDKVIGMMPEKINDWTGGHAPQGFWWKRAEDAHGHPIYEIQSGPFAQKISETYKAIVETMAREGHCLIIDDVAHGHAEVDRWRIHLKDFSVLWVGLKVPLEVLEERERTRGNRIQGSARAQFYKVHRGVSYDLELDTSKLSFEECTAKILGSLSDL